MISFFLGGARSGKSRRALDAAGRGLFVATAESVDVEFERRIQRHQDERGEEWQTIECPVDLSELLAKFNAPDQTLLIDCLTVWLGNLMHYEADITARIEGLIQVLESTEANVYLVSNEVGQGIVPEHPMGREFRDLQGRLNQEVARVADRVELMVAGIPITVKP
jgi:adenosylcobinamide kinase/adenosylcobinamide-phosphate guanylyltransferase